MRRRPARWRISPGEEFPDGLPWFEHTSCCLGCVGKVDEDLTARAGPLDLDRGRLRCVWARRGVDAADTDDAPDSHREHRRRSWFAARSARLVRRLSLVGRACVAQGVVWI